MAPYYPPRRKQEFFVDTEFTCFLCLHEITPDPCHMSRIRVNENDDDDTVRMNMSEENYAEKEKEAVSLRSVFKLIGMDGGKVLGKELTAGAFPGSNLVNSDFSVVLCKTCLQTTTKLTNLFNEWEVIQMKMDNAVQKFAEILEHSEGDPNLLVQLRTKLIDPLEQLQGSVAQVLRKETLKKCRRHFKKSWPKVTLYRTNKAASTVTTPVSTSVFIVTPSADISAFVDEFPTEYEVEHETRPKLTSCSDCGQKFTHSKSIYKHKKLFCKFRPKVQHPAPGPDQQDTLININDLLGNMPRVKVENEQDLYVLCTLCPSTNTSHEFTEPDMTKHIIADHCDYFFASVKRIGYSAVKFREFCNKLLRDELLACQTDRSEVPACTYNCSYCPNMYPDEFDTFSHLVQDHFSIYACKLKDLQRGTKETSATGIVKIGRHYASRDPCWCDICGQKLAHRASLRRHKKLSCSIDNPQSRKSTGDGSFRCEACGKNLSQYANLWRHKKYHCSKIPRARRVRDDPCCCDACGKKLARKSYLHCHKKYYCTGTPQATPNSSNFPCRCDACGKKLSHKSDLRLHKKLYCSKRINGGPKSGEDSCLCDTCGKKFGDKSSLWRHRRKQCPDRNPNFQSRLGLQQSKSTLPTSTQMMKMYFENSQQSISTTDTLYVKDEDDEEVPMELSSFAVENTKLEVLEPWDVPDLPEPSMESVTLTTKESLMLDDLTEV